MVIASIEIQKIKPRAGARRPARVSETVYDKDSDDAAKTAASTSPSPPSPPGTGKVVDKTV